MSDNDSEADDEIEHIVRQQAVFIADKRIMTYITTRAEHARDWICDVEYDNANPFRLIVGLDIKLCNPQLRRLITPPSPPVAVVVLCVHRRCLIFELAFANRMSRSLFRFLSDRVNNTLVGVGIEAKLAKLRREFGGLGGGARWVDLGEVTAERYRRPELREAGVSELRMFLHGSDVERPSPAVVEDWDDELTSGHVRQACVDAYVCYELGSYLVFPTRRDQEVQIMRNTCPDGL